jgi:hypothetical protein
MSSNKTLMHAALTRLSLLITTAAIIAIPFTTSTAATTFSGDWESGLVGRGNWKYIQAVDTTGRFTRVTSPVRQGNYSARVEVRPGDDPIGSSGNRAEVLVMSDASGNELNESEASGTQYFAFSFRLDTTWQAPAADANGAWAIIFQLHGPDNLGASPSVDVSVLNHLAIGFYSGDLDSAARSVRYRSYALSDSSLNIGHWVDLVLRITFARDFTGSVTAWRRNEGQAGFTQQLQVTNVPTLQYRSSLGGVGAHYWKHGLYCSKQTSITNVLWVDGMTRADSYNEAAHAAFGTVAATAPLRVQRSCGLGVTPDVQSRGAVCFRVSLPSPDAFSLTVFDATGRLLWQTRQTPSSVGEYPVLWQPEASMPTGAYLVNVKQDGKFATGRLTAR